MDKKRLAKIEKTWIGADKKLTVIDNASYQMVEELIEECKILANDASMGEGKLKPFPEISSEYSSQLW